jgi:ABC-type glycerol-3-phosphate transport system substrate-binding protein
MALMWAAQKNLPVQPIPPLSTPHTFADGWMWSLAGSSPENQQVATDLAEFLMDAEFLRSWTEASGYLPTRLTQDTPERSLLESAQALPAQAVLDVLSPVLFDALKKVWAGEAVPSVVRSALEQVQ